MKKGFCFVDLADKRDADEAVKELNGQRMLGMK